VQKLHILLRIPFFHELLAVGIFGSYIRGEQKKGSDVDVLIDFCKPIGLLKFIELKRLSAEPQS